MNILKSFLALILFAICLPMAGQAPAYDELEFEPDSVSGIYKPSGKNYALVRSKRGTSGVNKTAQADAILNAEVTEIVLVFSETDAGAIEERDEANQERWENLLKTYPELFQFSTTYKNVCQCKIGGDADAMKQTQGFYIYVNGEVPKMAEEPKVAATPPAAKEEKKAEPVKTAEAPKTAVVEEKKAAEKKVAEEKQEAKKEVAAADNTAVKKEAPPAMEEPVAAKKAEKPAVEEDEPETPKKAAPAKKKPALAAKSRKAKDAKACRYACYGNGDEDLNLFFKDNLKLSKKDRKKAKKQTIVVKLQLNVDGTIKKALVTCPDEKMNVLVTEAVKSMNPWNATVKNGSTIKSEVKITLKYDKPSKSLKPMETTIMPRLQPKCNKCMSDSEMFD